MGQSNFNDNNANIKHKYLEDRITETYVNKSNSTLKRSLYDSYIKSIRWASDRIECNGIIAFVTNGSFIKTATAAGMRACLEDEFTSIYCFDLRGNQRT
jgi:predicted helicase